VREGEGPTSKEDGRKGKKERGDGKGEGISPQSKVNTAL